MGEKSHRDYRSDCGCEKKTSGKKKKNSKTKKKRHISNLQEEKVPIKKKREKENGEGKQREES